MRRVELAAATAFGTAERLHRVGVLPAPASELAFVVYPWTVAADRLRAAGWEPRWSSAACLDVLLEGVQGRLPWPVGAWARAMPRPSVRPGPPSRSSARRRLAPGAGARRP